MGSAPKGVALSVYIRRLVWLCMLPSLVLTVLLASNRVNQEREAQERDAHYIGQTLSHSVDQYLNARIGGLQILAASPLLDDPRQHQALYQNAQGFLQSFGSHVILAEPNLQMQFNTRAPWGTALPPVPLPKGHSAAEMALHTGKPAVGDIVQGPIAHAPLIAVAVPALRQGTVRWLFLTTCEIQQFDIFLSALDLPAHWTISLRDGNGQTIARRGPAPLAPSSARSQLFVSRSGLSTWTTVLEIPSDDYVAVLQSTALVWGLAVLLVLAVGMLGGTWASRRLNASLASLVRGRDMPASHWRITEIDAVDQLLQEAHHARDIAQAVQLRSRERFQRFFQAAPLPLAIVGTDKTVLDLNARFIQTFGYALAELPDLEHWWDQAFPDPSYRNWAVQSWSAALVRAQQSGADIAPAEYRFCCKDGSVRIMTLSGIVLGQDVLITFFDITERRQSEERFRLAMDATQDGLWDIDLQTRQVFLTPRFYTLTGYQPGEFAADIDFLRRCVHPDDWDQVRQINMSHVQGDTAVSAFDFRLVRANSDEIWVEGRAKTVGWRADGRPERIVGVVTDISKRKASEQALRESEAFTRSVLDSVASHVAVLDPRGLILAVNAPWRRFAQDNALVAGELPAHSGVGTNYLDICREDPDASGPGRVACEGIEAVLRGELPSFSQEYSCHSPEQMRWFAMYVTPLMDTRHGAVVVHTDITERYQAENERRRANALAGRLAVVADAAVNYALVMLDAVGRIVDWSHGAESLTHTSKKQALGRNFDSFFTEERRQAGRPAQLLELARADGHVALQECLVRADHSEFVGSGILYCLPEDSEGASYAAIISDVTAAQQAARQVAESEARLAAVIAAASDAIVSTNNRGVVQMFNPAAERIFQVPATQMVGKSLDRLIPDMALGMHQKHIQNFAASGVTRRAMGAGKVEALRADGQRIELEASISKAMVGGVAVLTAILRDITDRTRAERAVVQYQVQLAGLAHRLLAQEKDTTQKLAQALHDDLGQTLAALRLIFEVERKGLEQQGVGSPRLERMERLIQDANRQARQVLTDLRPPQLDEQGLQAALDNELRQRQRDHENIVLQMHARTDPPAVRWPSAVEYAAFMVAREAINNALTHAAPANISVHLRGHATHLVLSVRDDGQGMRDLGQLERIGHLGMVGMRERAAAIGAKLEVQSDPARGTRIRLQWGASQ